MMSSRDWDDVVKRLGQEAGMMLSSGWDDVIKTLG